jgi:hypothetical protein
MRHIIFYSFLLVLLLNIRAEALEVDFEKERIHLDFPIEPKKFQNGKGALSFIATAEGISYRLDSYLPPKRIADHEEHFSQILFAIWNSEMHRLLSNEIFYDEKLEAWLLDYSFMQLHPVKLKGVARVIVSRENVYSLLVTYPPKRKTNPHAFLNSFSIR